MRRCDGCENEVVAISFSLWGVDAAFAESRFFSLGVAR